ncbi:MAG TPA: hypothetical protein VJ302_03255, partial [Blastocatellia bacterium]|nr:hypothetical protein [Blastocatellia bacterium]
LLPALERMFELASAQNQVLQSSFSLSSESATTADVKAPQFWRSLKRAEKLAARIQEASRQGVRKNAK